MQSNVDFQQLIASLGDAVVAADAEGAEGQLMLDGSLLGRWIIDHLGQEADRAPVGGVAFDPRQARAWA